MVWATSPEQALFLYNRYNGFLEDTTYRDATGRANIERERDMWADVLDEMGVEYPEKVK